MLEVMQRFPHFCFQLQTNATLISKLPDKTLGRLSSVLASIDGGGSLPKRQAVLVPLSLSFDLRGA